MEFQQRDYVVMGVLGVIIVVAVISGLGSSVSGNAISYFPTDLNFAVFTTIEDNAVGWTDCSMDLVPWESLDSFCKYNGYNGALPADQHPCLHEWAGTRWTWDGALPMMKGNSQRTAGVALTKVMCM